MYYIFENEEEAKDYDKQVSEVSNFPENDNWANPKKHPNENKWAILANSAIVLSKKNTVFLNEGWEEKNSINEI